MIEHLDTLNLLAQANQLFDDPEREYELLEFLKRGDLFRIHDYATMGDRPVSTYDCGSVKLKDTPKALYRAMFLFEPERVSFKGEMYKGVPVDARIPRLSARRIYRVFQIRTGDLLQRITRARPRKG